MDNREALHELLDLVIDTNGYEMRNADRTGNLPTVFFDFSGHVGELDFCLHSDGWRTGEAEDKRFEIDVCRPITDKMVREIRKACEQALEGKEHGIQ